MVIVWAIGVITRKSETACHITIDFSSIKLYYTTKFYGDCSWVRSLACLRRPAKPAWPFDRFKGDAAPTNPCKDVNPANLRNPSDAPPISLTNIVTETEGKFCVSQIPRFQVGDKKAAFGFVQGAESRREARIYKDALCLSSRNTATLQQ